MASKCHQQQMGVTTEVQGGPPPFGNQCGLAVLGFVGGADGVGARRGERRLWVQRREGGREEGGGDKVKKEEGQRREVDLMVRNLTCSTLNFRRKFGFRCDVGGWSFMFARSVHQCSFLSVFLHLQQVAISVDFKVDESYTHKFSVRAGKSFHDLRVNCFRSHSLF
nr:uncharacterized protein LOC112288462 isoform X1 [Physcomitrium patens]XP_024388413.1 uncharacterized protein LOC112288462 isoform X1 [Physcomitrium patens]XP_024388414.1 uncharacterized protein LOC112288462 isoform X1 [Physcomitrium patens]|eukprot:XP_024388412.1 uncharacterized protein LOC112288462 isoform X1 [Physcomitrella patens]